MNFILPQLRILVLLMLLVLPGLGLAAEGDPAPRADCENKAFSLHSALKSAQNQTDDANVILPNGLPGATKSKNIEAESAIQGFAGLLQRIINGLTAIAAAIAVFFIVFNGGGMMLAAGDTEKIKKARMGVIWALLGLLLIMGSYIVAKTAISLTYSGSDQQIEGQNQFGAGCDTEEEVVDEKPPVCDPGFVDEYLPDSCYEGDTRGIQTNNQQCNPTEFQNNLETVCSLINSSENLVPDNCSVEDVQKFLNDPNTNGTGNSFYSDPNLSCAQADNKYGQCTKEALENYINQKCSA